MTHFQGAIHIKKEKENRERRMNMREVLRDGLQRVPTASEPKKRKKCNYVSCDSCGTQKRKMLNVCTIAIVYFLAGTPLLPCYEAIHHKAQDSEEIILYIEGQPCHLVGSLEGCVCVCVVAGGGVWVSISLPAATLHQHPERGSRLRGVFNIPWQMERRRCVGGRKGRRVVDTRSCRGISPAQP